MQEIIKNKCEELLKTETVKKVLGWEKGIFDYDISPAIFTSSEELENLIYNEFCGINLSKYLIKETKNKDKVAVLLRPCDTYSLNQLLSEHRIKREDVYVVGVPCDGKKNQYGDLLKCKTCKGTEFKIYDEIIQGEMAKREENDKFEMVKELESMTSEERFDFWREELSKCIRCNACRNVCPACSCIKCVFDNSNSGVASKANADEFEENMFHIIRAFHVGGRCSDCGECSRVCPQDIPLHLLNRKIIKDINEFYGEYQVGESMDGCPPLTDFEFDDVEPNVVYKRGER